MSLMLLGSSVVKLGRRKNSKVGETKKKHSNDVRLKRFQVAYGAQKYTSDTLVTDTITIGAHGTSILTAVEPPRRDTITFLLCSLDHRRETSMRLDPKGGRCVGVLV